MKHLYKAGIRRVAKSAILQAVFLFLVSGIFAGADAYLYMFTNMGDVFRTQDGQSFSLISNTGYDDMVASTFVSQTQGYMLTRSGIILRTQDAGEHWQAISSISVSDAVDIIYANSNFYVLTESGDLYRGSGVESLNLTSSIGGNGFVSLANDGTYMYALTESGDVWRKGNSGSWNLVGSTGSTRMIALDALSDTLFAVNYYGDIMKSLDSGVSWQMSETVSQVGVTDMMVTEDSMVLICFDTGELMRRTSTKGWNFAGTASQVGVRGLAASGVPTMVGSGFNFPEFIVRPVVTRGVIRMQSQPGEVRIYSIDGKLQMKFKKPAGEMAIDISFLKSGIYFLRIADKAARIVKF